MTTFENRPRSALLVVDVQNGVVAEAHERDATVATIAGLVERARRQQVPVIWVQQTDDNLVAGSDAWHVVPELEPGADEPRVRKAFGDSFEDTELEQLLAERAVGRLVVVGAQTDACVRSTIHGAFTRGYDTTLVSDAHTTEDLSPYGAPSPAEVIAHTNLYWRYQDGPGRTAAVVEAADVDLSPA
ncbi:isochorismatase family protein [Cellulomonas sp. PhB150]|uniref:isochorismatase family protein n=1 Tax=Cellulomonas sp. PhB150 TaxID=2485188 RepID=UPI000F4ACEE7|nr:isochorismatase family protein [Cellulomonas sp. PhB150]ROS22939.1 nicotinamidase-related amidase [Cellulomonas sp. PhB150]